MTEAAWAALPGYECASAAAWRVMGRGGRARLPDLGRKQGASQSLSDGAVSRLPCWLKHLSTLRDGAALAQHAQETRPPPTKVREACRPQDPLPGPGPVQRVRLACSSAVELPSSCRRWQPRRANHLSPPKVALTVRDAGHRRLAARACAVLQTARGGDSAARAARSRHPPGVRGGWADGRPAAVAWMGSTRSAWMRTSTGQGSMRLGRWDALLDSAVLSTNLSETRR